MNHSTRVVLGPRTRLSYCHVWEPKSINGGDPKYSLSAIIPKDDLDTVDKINAAIEAAYREGESKLKGKGALPQLAALKTPLRDGDLDRPDDPAYAGCWFLNANSDRAPGIVDANCNPIRAERRFTPAATAACPSLSLPSTRTATAGSPAG